MSFKSLGNGQTYDRNVKGNTMIWRVAALHQ